MALVAGFHPLFTSIDKVLVNLAAAGMRSNVCDHKPTASPRSLKHRGQQTIPCSLSSRGILAGHHKHSPAFIRSILVPICTLQTIGAMLPSQLVMGTGEAASHRVRANQQQEVIPADLGGPVRLVVRCSE